MNAREQLNAAADWLGWQDENLSFGMKSPEDALKLWLHWSAHPEYPEMADEECDGFNVKKLRKQVLGYDPLVRAQTLIREGKL